jgi:hypothetical protein
LQGYELLLLFYYYYYYDRHAPENRHPSAYTDDGWMDGLLSSGNTQRVTKIVDFGKFLVFDQDILDNWGNQSGSSRILGLGLGNLNPGRLIFLISSLSFLSQIILVPFIKILIIFCHVRST